MKFGGITDEVRTCLPSHTTGPYPLTAEGSKEDTPAHSFSLDLSSHTAPNRILVQCGAGLGTLHDWRRSHHSALKQGCNCVYKVYCINIKMF